MSNFILKKENASIAPALLKLANIGEKLIFLVVASVLVSVILLHRQTLLQLLSPAISDVQLQGRFVHIDRLHIDRLVQDNVGRSFFNVDLQAVRQTIEAIPWVKAVHVTKVWPRALNITIEEHQAEARWGENSMISSESAIFSPKETGNRHLPLLYAREGLEMLTLSRYRVANKLLVAADIAGIEVLVQTPMGAWKMLLENGVSVWIGDTDWAGRLQKFVSIWQSELSDRSDQVRHVDLRYPDGCAVEWRE